MSRYVTVEVTAEDIAEGERDDGYNCPLARAVHRAGYIYASIDYDKWDPFSAEWLSLPKSAQRFVIAFDAEKPVKPARFRLPLSEARL